MAILNPMTEAELRSLDRPDPALLRLYLLQSLLTGPAFVIILPILLFRYHTLRYRFDEEGIHMSVGVLFRREMNLSYARIQDLHLQSGILQRWFGLANILVQTASGNAMAEMVIEGFHESERIRDYLYSRMRGATEKVKAEANVAPTAALDSSASVDLSQSQVVVALLREIQTELHGVREQLEGFRDRESHE